MNKVMLVGRLTKDVELKLTPNQTQFCGFTVAVDRKFKDANGQRQADFISCLAWKQTAVFIQKYFKKGSRIGLVGSIQTRSYDDQNGQKHFVTEVIVEEVEFVESKSEGQPQPQEVQTVQNTSAAYSAPVQTVPVQPQEEPGELPFEISGEGIQMFVESTNGAKTPKDIAKSLKKYGSLLAVFPDPIFCGERKYYSIKEQFDDERIVEVLYMGGEAVATTYLPKEARKAILMQKNNGQTEVSFGEF